jgi:nucleotide-binding universal stress UspA family protein
MQRILCAVDHSDPSLRAVHLALRLAAGCKLDLLLLNVVRLPGGEQAGIADYLRYEHNADPPSVVMREAAQDELARLREQLSPESDVAITCEIRTGEAATAIVAAAKDCQADLIVVGHRSQNRLAQALLGSVARRVLETAPCPVVVVR